MPSLSIRSIIRPSPLPRSDQQTRKSSLRAVAVWPTLNLGADRSAVVAVSLLPAPGAGRRLKMGSSKEETGSTTSVTQLRD